MKNSEEKRREKASSFGFKVVERKHQLNSSSSSLGIETLSIMSVIDSNFSFLFSPLPILQ